MTTSDSAKPDSPYLEVPRHFTSISRLGRVPSISWDDIVQETAAIFDGGYQLTLWPDTPGFERGVLAPRRDKVQSRIMPCACKRWCAWTRADRRR